MTTNSELVASYEHCRNLAWTAARNFYYGFALLPPAKRDALCSLYAFMRHADDISDSNDDTTDKSRRLKSWRNTLDQTLNGTYNASLILPALHHTVQQYRIPVSYFHDLI